MICYPLLGNNGEFGNQLFQIAATISHALNCNTNALFPEWKHNKIFKKKLNTYKELPLVENKYTEKYFYFSPIPKLPNLALNGYFQTEKYFKNKKEEILNLFEFEDSFLNMVTSKYKDLLANNPIGVQIRTYSRGMIDPRHIHCDVLENEAYLKESFKYFGKNKIFLVTTDNVEYTKKRIPNKENIYILDSNNLYEEFCLLTLCSGIISSASSFGWWASYLNKNKNKKIIMPQKWFNVKDDWYDTRDIYPEGVIIL